MNPVRKLLVCLIVAGVLPALASAETKEEMMAAAKALDATFLKAYNARDLDAVAATYWKSSDAVSLAPDVMAIRGWDAIRAGFAEAFKNLPPGAKLELKESHYSVVGEVVLCWGLWKFTVPGEDGKPMVSEGRYSDAKAKRDGKWVYLMDHISVPMAPPAE